MSAFTTVIVRITKTNTKSLTVGKKSARKLIEYFRIQNRCFLRFWSWRCRRFRTKRRNKFACGKISSSMSAILFALIFSRAERASTFDISAERNVWLRTVGCAIVCDRLRLYGNSCLCDRLRSTICDPRSSAIVCDHMETSFSESGKSLDVYWKLNNKKNCQVRESNPGYFGWRRLLPAMWQPSSLKWDIFIYSKVLV